MKTTVNIRDDVFRRAKARAALKGMSLSRFLEASLESSLKEEEPDSSSWAEWFDSLPAISSAAAEDLNAFIESSDFRPIDKDMWQ